MPPSVSPALTNRTCLRRRMSCQSKSGWESRIRQSSGLRLPTSLVYAQTETEKGHQNHGTFSSSSLSSLLWLTLFAKFPFGARRPPPSPYPSLTIARLSLTGKSPITLQDHPCQSISSPARKAPSHMHVLAIVTSLLQRQPRCIVELSNTNTS